MGKKLKKLLTAVLAVVFLVSVGMVAYKLIEYRAAENVYQQAEELAGLPGLSEMEVPDYGEPEPGEVLPPDPVVDALRKIDIGALRQVNEDTVGWIFIPGTKICYPVVQGEDNRYYLNYLWTHERNRGGAIFMDSKTDPGLGEFNTLIFGHHLRSGDMFTPLKNYKDDTYRQQHPRVYLAIDSGVYRYVIYSAWEARIRASCYYLHVTDPEKKQEVIDDSLKNSVLNAGIIPTTDDQLLTLSTCTTRGGAATRWVVQSVLEYVYPPIYS